MVQPARPGFVGVPLAIAVLVQPLGPVDAAHRLRPVAKVQPVDTLAGVEEQL